MHRRPTFTFPFGIHSVSMCSFSIQMILPIRKMVAWFSCWSIRIRRHFSNWMQQQLNRIRPSNSIRQSNVAVYSYTNCRNNMLATTVTLTVCSNVNCERLWICVDVRRSFCRIIFPTELRPMSNAHSSTINVWHVTQVSRIFLDSEKKIGISTDSILWRRSNGENVLAEIRRIRRETQIHRRSGRVP